VAVFPHTEMVFVRDLVCGLEKAFEDDIIDYLSDLEDERGIA
jgi:hypothetical protein